MKNKRDNLVDRNLYLIENIDTYRVKAIIESINNINIEDDLNSKKFKNYKRNPIKLHIDNYGGEVYSALGLYSVIKSSKTKIYTYALGSIMSAALFIFLAGKKRFATKYSTFMFHEVSSMFWDKLTGIKQNVKEMERLQNITESIIIDECDIDKKTTKKIKKYKKDWYIDSKKAKKLKIFNYYI